MKCVYCGGKTRLGIHNLCWVELKRHVLSDKWNVPSMRTQEDISLQTDNATYIDKAGHHVVQGRVVVPINPDELYE